MCIAFLSAGKLVGMIFFARLRQCARVRAFVDKSEKGQQRTTPASMRFVRSV